MAWDEWEQLKASAAERQSTQMQLNQLPEEDRPNTGTAPGDLEVSQKDLAAIGDEAFKLYGDLDKKARPEQIHTAAFDIDQQGFALGKALQHVSNRWARQLGSLMDACALISNHMEFSKKVHGEDDTRIQRHVSSIETLDKGFDESYAPPGEPNKVYGPKDKD
ncbi:hypothetical protein LIX60_07815 [Streptomyces sp. S07_1.15]|uniref:hypothetical protein n=1 Tax=Streptomyces sp. S07_1.15 TaxID=2873925 RepID=UPI001D158737|nr:hypothetical protein [Streptomyces sp. S07_1.15]MCC3651376.1 hypothetical protein [Streptomyces sp. S07_1.15]